MKSITTKGIICLQDKHHFVYKIAGIEYVEYEDEFKKKNFKYTFIPNYNVIDLLSSDIFQGIPGLKLEKRKEVYERNNIVPVFISERSPSDNRENLKELLEECNMTENNRLEWLIRTNTRYFGDPLYVERYEEKKTYHVDSMYELVERSNNIIKKLLQIIAYGDDLISKEIEITDANRKMIYNLLMPIYTNMVKDKKEKQQMGIDIAKANNKYKGRQKKQIDVLSFSQIKEDYLKHNITADKASKILGISRSTFLRRVKDLIK